MALTAVFNGSYKRVDVTGKLVDRFRYIVTGDKTDLERYEVIKGEYHRPDQDGNPLYFSKNFLGQRVELKFTLDGERVYPDTANQDIAKNLINQNEGILAQEMAKLVAAQMLGQAYNRTAPVATAVTEQAKVANDAGDGLDN